MLKGIFHDSLKISKLQGFVWKTIQAGQELFSSYKSFSFSASVAIATLKIF